MKTRVRPQHTQSLAFTFVEVFAAMVFLAILVPAIVEGLSVSSRVTEAAQRGSIAGELAENKLNEVIVSGSAQTAGNMQGDFGTDYPGYRWQLSEQSWPVDNVNLVSQVTVQVYYPVQGQERSFQLDTLVSGTSQYTNSQ